MARTTSATGNYLSATPPVGSTSPLQATLSVWIYPTSTAGDYTGTLTIGTANFSMYVKASNGTAYYAHVASGGPFVAVDPGSSTLSNNTWYHQAASYSASDGLRTYINGASDGTAAGPSDLNVFGDIVYIGNDTAASTRYFAGRVADAAIWNVVLTAGEISALAKGVRPYFIRPQNLFGYWPIDGLVSPEQDFSGGVVSGGIYNATVNGTTPLANGPPLAMFTPRWPNNELPSSADTTIAVYNNIDIIKPTFRPIAY